MNPKIFRKSALERLQSPEQLDQTIRITSPSGWIALAALWLLLITAILWGIYGSIPSKVTGGGMLIKSGGVYKVVSQAAGQITDISVNVGEMVRKGDIVARLAQWDVLEEIRSMKARLAELNTKREQIASFGQRNVEMQKHLMEEQRSLYESSIASVRANIRLQEGLLKQQLGIYESAIKNLEGQRQWQLEKITNQEQLFDQGLIVKQSLLNTRQQHEATVEEIKKLHAQIDQEKAAHEQRLTTSNEEITQFNNQMQQLDIKRLELEKQQDIELLSLDQQINDFERRIQSLTEKMQTMSRIISPYTGRILEITLNENDVVAAGSAIMTMELTGKEIKDIELVLYVPSADGKKVRPGMDVQISPSTIKKEEFGSLLGKVTSVGLFPATPAGMMKVLGNEALVREMMAAGTPIEVYADLIPSSATVSGYKWTSPRGPNTQLYSGTQCVGEVVVKSQRPISLVIPLLKETFGIY